MMVKKIGVMGAGMMGGGIAHVAAISGYEVVLCDIEQRFVDGAVKRAADLMDKNIAKQKITVEDKEAILKRITTTTNTDDFAAVDFVIEAIVEDLEVKKNLFAKLDKICKPDTVFATNTSSMSITALAAATSRPEKFVGMHFFNPAQVMKLVEVIRGYNTSDETLQLVLAVAQAMGKKTVECKKDTPGFIVNRILFAQFFEAARMLEEGVATIADIDTAVTSGLNYPMGPFTLMDFGGIDLGIQVGDYFYNETKDSKWNPPHTLKALVKAGRTGKKAGAGWYDYNK
jgi:3-hydroxybutyryl-CoA dehydrogenase